MSKYEPTYAMADMEQLLALKSPIAVGTKENQIPSAHDVIL